MAEVQNFGFRYLSISQKNEYFGVYWLCGYFFFYYFFYFLFFIYLFFFFLFFFFFFLGGGGGEGVGGYH